MARGDHVYVRRSQGYTHHGIDAGDGTVIHFTGEPGQAKINARIARTEVSSFLGGGRLVVREYGKRDDAGTTLARAQSRLGETGYHLVVNNCEHFATWCCTGRGVSEQVKGVSSLTANGVLATGAAGVAPGLLAGVGFAGVSGPGVMSALATMGGPLGAAAGPAVIGAAPALASVLITSKALSDDESLTDAERKSRKEGRVASRVGAAGASIGTLGAISAAGTVSGLSAAGISSGLAAIGAGVGGGMVAGATVLIAAPAVAAAGAGTGVYFLARGIRRRRGERLDRPIDPETSRAEAAPDAP